MLMARKRSIDLTQTELRLMEVIWQKGKATVAEVVESLSGPSGPAYNTVLTTMNILERKGYLRHTPSKSGRAFVYHPVVTRRKATGNAVGHLLSRFFGGSAEALVLNLIEDKKLNDAELKRVREMFKEKQQ
jgi:predicted transcriptional regulator